MDVYHKLKQKLADNFPDESDNESTRDRYGSAAPTSVDPAVLQREILELKEHINKNYFVYVKRLERRKERIKELEEYAQLLIKDNEMANEQIKDYEDNLEQLEGFQSQELAKVKHMLLSAETALDKETQERKRLEVLVKEASATPASITDSYDYQQLMVDHQHQLQTRDERAQLDLARETDKIRTELTEMYEAKLARLTERVQQQDLGQDERLLAISQERDALEQSLAEAETKCQVQINTTAQLEGQVTELRAALTAKSDEVASVIIERDRVKNSLLDLEITNHENQAHLGSEREKTKLDVARLVTEKETLEVALDRRDKELKAKKETFRDELAKLEQAKSQADAEIHTKTVRIHALEAENQVLQTTRNHNTQALNEAQSLLDTKEQALKTMEVRCCELTRDFEAKQNEMTQVRQISESSTQERTALKLELDVLSSNYHQLVTDFEAVSEERDSLKSSCDRLKVEIENLNQLVIDLQNEINDRDATFADKVNQSERVLNLEKSLQLAEDEINDKKNIIKVHQQKMADMKKTFQKEMRTVAAAPSESSSSSSRQSPVRRSPSLGFSGVSQDQPEDMVSMTDVNLRYLKHVIFKFFTSREYEAKHLTRALAALLHFSSDEERLLQEHLEWKMSWFGAKPKSGSGQFSLSINSTT
ncbi:hypothetical protein TCAL_15188 [Tigriopus californicus]|uniref:GRIP domain-containing protein n=1 Tax=Tigriopus californicus TaxID=6832 RepID=A0A553ND96_TIGCA|nr:hypothetical protein TCAL_15188 [Tigriopus californicus]